MYDLLRDSPIFQVIAQEEQLRTLRAGIIAIVAAYYPELAKLAETQVTAIDDVERLQKLLVDVTMPYNAQEMRTLLLSLHNDKDNEKN